MLSLDGSGVRERGVEEGSLMGVEALVEEREGGITRIIVPSGPLYY